ncbi:MAG: hypothetical protein MZU97_15160 [Bacillus subtilis]|nr:hypothetical protein [Bacillus subtilis]
MVSRRLLRDRILAVVVLFGVLAYYLAPLLYGLIPMLSFAWFDVIRDGISVFMVGLFVFYLIEGHAYQTSVLAHRVPLSALVEGIRDANAIPLKQDAARFTSPPATRHLGFIIRFTCWSYRDLIQYAYFLGVYTLSVMITVLSILMIMAALVNALGLFVAQKQTEVSVFYDQIIIHIPDETALVVRKGGYIQIRLDYPKRRWKPASPRPTCEFVTFAPLVAIELPPLTRARAPRLRLWRIRRIYPIRRVCADRFMIGALISFAEGFVLRLSKRVGFDTMRPK